MVEETDSVKQDGRMGTGAAMDERHLRQRLMRALYHGVRQYQLIAPGDRVLVGLSGGKDSLSLLELLGTMRKRLNRSFGIDAIHVRMKNVEYVSDTSYLADFAKQQEADFHVAEAGFEPDRKENRSPCFLCAWHRRKVLFDVAQQMGCSKIALGHHKDDILRTALMNLAFNGSFSTMPVRLRMRKFPVEIIRPLALADEADLRLWASMRSYKPVEKVCPYDTASNRTQVERVADAFQSLNIDYKQSLWHALEKAGALIDE